MLLLYYGHITGDSDWMWGLYTLHIIYIRYFLYIYICNVCIAVGFSCVRASATCDNAAQGNLVQDREKQCNKKIT